jgi:integrase
VSGAKLRITSVDDLFRLDPLARFEALIAGPNFAPYLRAEPIRFERNDPIYGTSCGVPGCARHSTQAEWWCTLHGQARRQAARDGVGESDWLAGAIPYPHRGATGPTGDRLPACQFCPDRDATAGDLCRGHEVRLAYARRRMFGFTEEGWAARQVALPGVGDCRVDHCLRRAESDPSLCPRHRASWIACHQPQGSRMDEWLVRAGGNPNAGVVVLAGLQPLVAAEIRYSLWTHTKNAAPARWHPMWLRRMVKTCRQAGVNSLTELDPSDRNWTAQPGALNRMLREMHKDVHPIHHTRADTREFGYIDTNYWGFRFPDRRSAFDLTAISQRWLRDLSWDFLAGQLDGPGHPRTQGPFEQIRRSIVCFSTYLSDCDPHRGAMPSALSASTAKEFVADLKRCVTNAQPTRGVFNVNGEPSPATIVTYSLTMNALRRVMRWAMDSGAATGVGLAREFVVAIPFGGAPSFKNPRPFTDPVLRELSDPANIGLFAAIDTHDTGLADIWSIQVKCGRRIGEVVKLRLDCVGEHLGRTWMWIDMTKVDKLDYAIQIPRDLYDLICARQAKTIERFRLKHGAAPTAKQRRLIALFPSRITNPTFERSVSTSRFGMAFKAWLQMDQISLPGHTTHQARHTLATRLVNAGASMTHVKRVLGHVSERMGDSYVLIAGSQVEPFLQQVWVTGPGNAKPGQLVLAPTDAEISSAEKLMVDLAAIPIEHGLCTYKPVVGGFECPFGRKCNSCEHFVITGADYGYWKRQEERWAAMAEGAPDETARNYIYGTFERSSQALAGLEKALLALGLLDQAKELDLRSPHQDFFNPVWSQGWRAGDLVELGGGEQLADGPQRSLEDPAAPETRAAS